jgi:aconitate hydratase
MGYTLAEKIIKGHLVEGEMKPGAEMGIRVDQTLTQDATGTMTYLEFESVGISRVRTELSVSYVDHNIIQTDFKNAEDHRFLQSIAAKYGIYLSPPGNGVSHHVHRERFGMPGKVLIGADSHTTTGGCLGMLAVGVGGAEVAKDVILELLRRYSAKGGLGKIMEFFGPGLASLDMSARATIANMGADIGATAAIFPSDAETRSYLKRNKREEDWKELGADPDAHYDEITELDLSSIEPLIACPHNPDNVKTAAELEGMDVAQVIIGSSTNGSYRDLMIAAKVIEGKKAHDTVSFEINPGSRQTLENVAKMGGFLALTHAGARIHQSGCLGCIGMGQAPAHGTVSLRTMPRNFKGRSGTKDDAVYLCSPETAAASALFGKITDPRKLGPYPEIEYPDVYVFNEDWIIPPAKDPKSVEIIRGSNIKPFPDLNPLEENISAEILLKVGDQVSTDLILPGGNRVLPFRSNIPAISQFVFDIVDESFPARAKEKGGGIIVGGENYGQGSSREHAALAPRYLGIRAKIAKSFARIHKSNLVNFGIVPLEFMNPGDYDKINQGDTIHIPEIRERIARGDEVIPIAVNGKEVKTRLLISERHRRILVAGGLLNQAKEA